MLTVLLERDEDGYYIVSDDQSLVYGDGDSLSKAIWDYFVSLTEYYHFLIIRAKDHPPTEALLHCLQQSFTIFNGSPSRNCLM